MKSSNMKNAVIYARYSSNAQSEQSIEGQLIVIIISYFKLIISILTKDLERE